MLMYGIYNVKMLQKLIKTVHKIHNTASSHEKLFAGEHNHSIFRILYTHSLGLHIIPSIHSFISELFRINIFPYTRN